MSIQTNPCLLHGLHKPHYWWYTPEGGGHMMSAAFVDENCTQYWCLGLDHIAKHRGRPTPKWTVPKTPWNYKGRHCA